MLSEKEGIKYLTREGNFRVPCSRYGWDSESCAPIAYAVAVILRAETDSAELPTQTLDYVMGLVVNNHDDPEYMIRNYGAEYGFDPADYLTEEE